ncbi:hypothetical protein TURU_152051 [Turdus rufiventris]|nr:hypothetical protein TURU_152051 [Turdus rufiventris]
MSGKGTASQLQDPSLTMAKPFGNCSDTYVCLCDNIFKKEKKILCSCDWAQRRDDLPYLRNSSAETNASGEGEGAPGTYSEILLHPMVQTMVKQLCPCTLGGQWDKEIHLE